MLRPAPRFIVASALLATALLAPAIHAAQPPPATQAPASGTTMALRGQMLFLKSSTAFCIEKVPSLKAAFEDARDRAQQQMHRAEAMIQQEAKQQPELFRPLLETYAGTWNKYADTLVDSLKRQDAAKACPTLLENWQSADVELILEDWRGFVERSLP